MKVAGIALLCAVLAGCGGPEFVIISTGDLCQSWRHQRLHKGDRLTDKSASIVEGNNEARPAWGCEWGADRAKTS